MITKMTKYSFILLSGESEAFLENLQELGVVDIQRSTKPVDQVSSAMLEKTLGFHLETEHLDATDALAIAMCHYYSTTNPVSSVKKGSSGWEKYILEHPEKVK